MPLEHEDQSGNDLQLAAAFMLLHDYTTGLRAVTGRIVATTSELDVMVLRHLLLHPARRPHDLMAATGLSRPSVATVVVRLERLGLVQRSFGEHDRRTTLASLSAAGHRRMAELERALGAHLRAAMPTAARILTLLGCTGGPATQPGRPTAIESIERLETALAAVDAALDDGVQALPPRHRVAISTLMSWGLSRPTQLAEALQLSSGGLTYAMDQLESDGIITRTYGDPVDRRAVFVQLSAKGVEHGRSMCASLAAGAPAICAALSPALTSDQSA